MRSHKKTHVDAVAQLLEAGDYASSQDLAKAVIALVDTLREDDTTYAVVCQYDSDSDVQQPLYLAYGPYPTFNKALGAVEAGQVGISGYGKKAIVPVYTPEHVQKRFDSIDDLTQKHDAHWTRLWERANV